MYEHSVCSISYTYCKYIIFYPQTARYYFMDKKKENQPLLYRILVRTVLFFTLFLSSLLFFYTLGNYQEFIDKNQNLILSIATITAIILIFVSSAGLIVSVLLFFRKRAPRSGRYLVSFFWMVSAFFYGFAFMFITRIINFLSKGI